MSTAIEASTVRCQTMADGTLRLVLDIEPAQAQSAFRAFGSPGVPVAVARLKTKAEAAAKLAESERAKGGPLARLAGQWSNAASFQTWAGVANAEEAAQFIRAACGVDSRAKIDSDADAARHFHERIRAPFRAALDEATR